MSRRQAALLLVNDTARRAGSPHWLQDAVAALAPGFDLQVLHPASADELTALARGAKSAGADAVIVAGGDGTLSAAAHGLAGTGVAMGALPLGTANDLARELGIPREVHAAARHLAAAATTQPRAMDLGVVNGRHFCTVGGVGIISHATVAVSAWKSGGAWRRRLANLASGAVYRVSSSAVVLGRRELADDVSLRWTDADSGEIRSREGRFHTLFTCNHRTLGGGLQLPSGSRDDDGVMELCLVPEGSRPALAMNLARLSSGLRIPPGVFQVLRASDIRIEMREEVTFVADGDRMAHARSFDVAVRPGALRVIG